MKLSKQTLEILKNFGSINQSILFKSGQKQSTISSAKTTLAIAEFEESFPESFAIYDLNQFIGIISLFNDPEIEIDGKYVSIKSEKQEVRYRTCEPTLVASLSKEPTFPKVDISFEMSKEILGKISNAISMLKSEHIAFEGNGSEIVVCTHSIDDSTSSVASFTIGETTEIFTLIFKYDMLKLMQGDYFIQISKQKLTKWINKNNNVSYMIPASKNSTFE